MLEAQPLPLADAIAAHDKGTAAATDTVWSAWSVRGRAGRVAQAWQNDLRLLRSELIHVADELRALHGEQDNQQQQRDPKPAVSAVTAAMITHARRRGRDRRIRPLAPDAHRALDAYLREHRDLMTRVCCWADGLDPPPRLHRTVTSIAQLAASVGRRADMLLAVINRPPRP